MPLRAPGTLAGGAERRQVRTAARHSDSLALTLLADGLLDRKLRSRHSLRLGAVLVRALGLVCCCRYSLVLLQFLF